MKKLLLSLFILSVFFSCSDSDDNITVNNKQENVKYAYETIESYGLKADVKIVERIYYEAIRNEITNTIEYKLPERKYIYEFDEWGALIKRSLLNAEYGYENNGQRVFKGFQLSSETFWTYDDKYRTLDYTSYTYGYLANGLPLVDKTIYEYDDLNKMATELQYKGDLDKLTPIIKSTYNLDENGRIDSDQALYYRPIVKSTEGVISETNFRHHKNYDKKDNLILFYSYEESENYENPDYSYSHIIEYYEQAISYYDGTKSEVYKEDDENRNSLGFFHYPYSEQELKGKVKTLTQYFVYDDSLIWNKEEAKVENLILIDKRILNLDINKVIASEENFSRRIRFDFDQGGNTVLLYSDLSLDSKEVYKHDSKNRITEQISENYTYMGIENTPIRSSKNKVVIIYDEIDRTGTLLTYRYQGDVVSSTPTTKTVYKLNENGIIINSSYKYYNLKSANIDPKNDFGNTPYLKSEFVQVDDKNGNWIEKYNLNTRYNLDGTVTGYSVSSYTKREIIYY